MSNKIKQSFQENQENFKTGFYGEFKKAKDYIVGTLNRIDSKIAPKETHKIFETFEHHNK